MNQFENELRKDELSLRNRLLSIQHDALFVDIVCQTFRQLAVFPNERAGSWYVRPQWRTHGKSVYFKSTDGHFGQWDFSLRRLNLHCLPLISRHGGAVIVDVTRRGKRFPDSLSKTIPIWCSLLNWMVFGDDTLHVSPKVVSQQEKAQIEEKMKTTMIPKFAGCCPDSEDLKMWIKKPLRPMFFHACSRLPEGESWWSDTELEQLEFLPVVLVSASLSPSQDPLEPSEPLVPLPGSFHYVQGAADDSELWAPGLTAFEFWGLEDALSDKLSSFDVAMLVETTLEASKQSVKSQGENYNWLWNSGVAIGNRKAADPVSNPWDHFDVIVNCGAPVFQYPETRHNSCIYLDIPEGKKGQKAFYEHIEPFLARIHASVVLGHRILIHCMQGRDRSVGIAMALLLRYLSKDGTLASTTDGAEVTKQTIANLLIRIQGCREVAAPTRATMKKIHLYFIKTEAAG
ncbi:hypothetical protein HDU91_001554 [Kappamyces sp. JEL0680]|nr:hypothetical protein HDU91_001554 [Kappamyces sp. JEL0680]